MLNFQRLSAAIFALQLLVPVVAPAQQRTVRWQDSSAATLLLADKGGRLMLESSLRQIGVTLPRATLDALGDSLMLRALHPRGATPDDAFRQAEKAISRLTNVGQRTGEGTPYTGALERLIRIGQESPDPALRRRVLASVLEVGSVEDATDYLVTEAMRPDPTASVALSRLALALENAWINYRKATTAELAVIRRGLKRIWDGSRHPGNTRGVILIPGAAQILSRTACLEGWLMPASACANITRFPRDS